MHSLTIHRAIRQRSSAGCRAGTMNNSIDCACCPHMNHLRLEMSVFNTFNTFGAASAWARLTHLVIIVTTTKIKVKPNELRPSQNKQIDRGRTEREREGVSWTACVSFIDIKFTHVSKQFATPKKNRRKQQETNATNIRRMLQRITQFCCSSCCCCF